MQGGIYYKHKNEVRKLLSETRDKKYRLSAVLKKGHGEEATIFRRWLFWDVWPVAWYNEAENFILRYDSWRNPRSK